MHFSAREDIAAPIDQVFHAISDFEGFERAILRRGAEIARTDTMGQPGAGMTWDCRFDFRGKRREMQAELTRFDRPELVQVAAESAAVEGTMTVELVQLSPRQTRMQVVTEFKPRTLTARLLVQSMRLAKTSLVKRYRTGVRKFARDIEGRLGSAPQRY